MKVSIITASYNSAATIRDTLESVRSQTHHDIEHIVADGGSTDDTMAIVGEFPHVASAVSERDAGLYDAINRGMARATGDVIGILNSDDFFAADDVVADVVRAFESSSVDAVYGDVEFVDPSDLDRVVRRYSSRRFRPEMFRFGFMPAHPSFYARRHLFDEFGAYRIDYKIAADFELLLRFLRKHAVRSRYLDRVFVTMRTGGMSNATVASRLLLNQEIVRACRTNGVWTSLPVLSAKYVVKSFEYVAPSIARFRPGSRRG